METGYRAREWVMKKGGWGWERDNRREWEGGMRERREGGKKSRKYGRKGVGREQGRVKKGWREVVGGRQGGGGGE